MNTTLRKSLIALLITPLVFIMTLETSAAGSKASEPKGRKALKSSAVPDIRFTVSMSKPWTHLLEVEMRVKAAKLPDQTELKMPVWTPGSYLVREYSRHVQDFSIKDGRGRDIAWRKISKNTWQVDSKGSSEIVATYRVYSNELTVRTNELNDEHAFWNNAALLMFPKGHLNAPSTVTVVPFGKWKVATGLPRVTGSQNTFRASDFDVLYDAPFEVSDFKEIGFEVAGKPHRIVVTGDGNYDLKQMAADTARIGEEAVKIFGEIPVDDYLIILNLRGSGGLEHLNSTALQWNRFGFKPRSQYVAYLGLVAHEYFHLWNVKRIRPDVLGPFDYENENYTGLLWVAEGTTAYYEGLLLRRAGISSDQEILAAKAEMIQQLQNRPGRFETSLEEASFDAWIKYYRQDQNSINNQISYYDKGEVVSMMLDLTIRTSSNGSRSLDDVMRSLYNEFFKKGRNYTSGDFQRTCETMAGRSLDDFFAKYVRGRAEIDYNSMVSGLGLELKIEQPNAAKAYIGADLAEESGRLTVRRVAAGTPAFEQGLNFNDQIVAIDGHRASLTFLQNYLDEKRPNDKIKLAIFRHDRLREVNFTLGSNSRYEARFVPVKDPSERQREMYKQYFGVELK